MILERMCNSIKSCTKKALVTGIIFGSIFAATSYNSAANNKNIINYAIPSEVNKLKEFSNPDNSAPYNLNIILNPSEVNIAASATTKSTSDSNKPWSPFLDSDEPWDPFLDSDNIKENPPFVTTVYGEAGHYSGIFNENPMFLNIISSYNLFDKSPSEGALLLTGRVIAKEDTESENFWNKYFDLGAGISYRKDSVIVGIEGFHRTSFDEENQEGDGFRLWGGFWNRWELKELEVIETFPGRVWGTNYFEFDYNTLEKNTVADFKTTVNLNLLNLGGFIIGPFAEGRINYDTGDEPWYRYYEVGGGVRIRKGPFNALLGSVHRGLFDKDSNKDRLKGNYNKSSIGVWFPIYY